MNEVAAPMLDWSNIDLVLLDLDGTLLDLAYDNAIWLALLPERYAEARGLSIAEAQAELAPKFRRWRGTLEWFSVDFWSRETGIDLGALHREERARIRWLPGARETLAAMRERALRLVVMTDSHPDLLALKNESVRVLDHVDAAFSSHRFGAPKQDPRFWPAARRVEPYDPAKTLFVDDNPAVTQAALEAGIRHVCLLGHPDSSRDPRVREERGDSRAREPLHLDRLVELLPGLKAQRPAQPSTPGAP